MFKNLATILKNDKDNVDDAKMMDLQKAKLLVESYENETGFAIPIAFTELGLCYESSSNDYIMFNHKRKFSAKISAIKFIRCGKLSHDTLKKQDYEV